MAKRDTGWSKWEPVAIAHGIDYHTYYRRVMRSKWDEQTAATAKCMDYKERQAMSVKARKRKVD